MTCALRVILAMTFGAAAVMVHSQTTDGFVAGVLRDSVSGNLISGASVSCDSDATSTHVTAKSGPGGSFGLPLLPPGLYRIRVEEDNHQAIDIQNLVLPVAECLIWTCA